MVECDVHRAGETDELADTIDYSRLHQIVRDVVEGPHRNLLETLATKIAAGVLDEPGVTSVSVRVAKRPAGMQPIDSAAVHIKRTRASAE